MVARIAVDKFKRKLFTVKRSPTPQKRRHAEFVLWVDGKSVGISKTEAALLTLLYKECGQVLSYHRFSRILGRDCTKREGLHLLHAFMARVRDKLVQVDAPYKLLTSREFGCAICKIAKME
jgi:hypothetical protein